MKYIMLLIVIMSALFIRLFVFSVYKTSSNSMLPVIFNNEYLLVSKAAYGFKLPWSDSHYFTSEPQKGDIIAYSARAKTFVKRIIAVPNDVVTKNKNLLTVGESSYTLLDLEAAGAIPEKLESEKFLVINENLSEPSLSPEIEVISRDQIVGRLRLVLYSGATTQASNLEQSAAPSNRILTNIK